MELTSVYVLYQLSKKKTSKSIVYNLLHIVSYSNIL